MRPLGTGEMQERGGEAAEEGEETALLSGYQVAQDVQENNTHL